MWRAAPSACARTQQQQPLLLLPFTRRYVRPASYSVHKAPFCGYGRCNAVGEVVSSFSVDIPDPVMMHDFAVTDKHAIIIDVPLLFKPEHMIKSGTLPFVFDKTRRGGTRFGVLPRDAASADAIQWFETGATRCSCARARAVPSSPAAARCAEPFMAFHVAAAWEEEDSIHVVLCAFADFSLDTFVVTGEDSLPYLTEVRLELATGGTTVRRLTSLPGDFPVVPPAPLGRRPRYVFLAAMQQPTTPDGVPCFNGVAKVDLQSSSPDSTVAGRIVHPPGCSGGEASFVARPGGSGEDDGCAHLPAGGEPPGGGVATKSPRLLVRRRYLVTFITDAEATQSWLVIYDARTMSSQPVVRLRLPQRVSRPRGAPAGALRRAGRCSSVAAALLAGAPRLSWHVGDRGGAAGTGARAAVMRGDVYIALARR